MELFSANRLIVLYICINFRESTSMGFRVIERTRFVMDRHGLASDNVHTSEKEQVPVLWTGQRKAKI